MDEDWDEEASQWDGKSTQTFKPSYQPIPVKGANGWDDNWGSGMDRDRGFGGRGNTQPDFRGRGRGAFGSSGDGFRRPGFDDRPGTFRSDQHSAQNFGDAPKTSWRDDSNRSGERRSQQDGGSDALVMEVSDRDVGKIIGK